MLIVVFMAYSEFTFTSFILVAHASTHPRCISLLPSPHFVWGYKHGQKQGWRLGQIMSPCAWLQVASTFRGTQEVRP